MSRAITAGSVGTGQSVRCQRRGETMIRHKAVAHQCKFNKSPIDRITRRWRHGPIPCGLIIAKPGTLLENPIPTRTLGGRKDAYRKSGFIQGGQVARFGNITEASISMRCQQLRPRAATEPGRYGIGPVMSRPLSRSGEWIETTVRAVLSLSE